MLNGLKSVVFGRYFQMRHLNWGKRFISNYTRGPARFNYVVNFVPHQEAWVVERFGRFFKVLSPGLQILLPVVDKIKYIQSLKEVAVNIPEQTAVTNDNATLIIDGVLFYQVIDPYKASYEIENHEYAIKQIAQTTMRSEIGKLILDDVFKERDTLNKRIVDSIRSAAVKWGIECMRYEIRNVEPPLRVLEAMQMQVEAERKKRVAILESEGLREAAINKASGEAKALKINAESRAIAIKTVAEALGQPQATQSVSYTIAEQYISAFSNLAKTSNTVILPKNVGDISSCIAESIAIYKNLNIEDKKTPSNGFEPNSVENLARKKKEEKCEKSQPILESRFKSPQKHESTWKKKLEDLI